MTLPRAFYARPALDVAVDLIGKVLVHRRRGTQTSGIIVEVEAYIGESDPACHAAPGPTQRNQPLYGPPGHAYVYLNYGIHALANVVVEPEGSPAAILIRALEPLEGVDAMRRRRARLRAVAPPAIARHDLCRGPGNLTAAMGITLADNRVDLLGDRLWLENRGIQTGEISWSRRIGISLGIEHEWRAYLAGHPSVSGRRTSGSRRG